MDAAAGSVAAVIPAKDEADRIAATVAAVRQIPGVDLVVVVDDGSGDSTAQVARQAGALVVVHSRNRGKAAAMETGAGAVALHEQAAGSVDGQGGGGGGDDGHGGGGAGDRQGRGGGDDGTPGPRPLLFVDADLGETASGTAPLVPPVLAGEADMTIAVLPQQLSAGGGRGLVVNLSRKGIVRATGWTPTQPLSGMRCLTRGAFEAALPLARGWGVETALTIDLLTQGFRVLEVPCDLQHRVTGTDLRAQLHRAAQYRDVARALAVRRARRGPRRSGARPR